MDLDVDVGAAAVLTAPGRDTTHHERRRAVMRRKILIAVLALGTVGGYASGFAHMRCEGRSRRAALEAHVAKVCIDAAKVGKGSSELPAALP